MTTKSRQADLARRGFLAAATRAGVLGALAILMGRRTAVAEVAAAPVQSDEPTGGYRETEHIRKYYRCASYW